MVNHAEKRILKISETSKLKDLLNNGKIGDTKSISFKWQYFGNQSSTDIAKLIFTKTATLEVIDNTFNYCSELTEDDTHWDDITDNVKPSSTKESVSDADWDKVLDEYESYVNSYVKLAKKANKGDMTALAEYPDMLKNAQSLGNELSNAKVTMTPKQLKRYMAIQTKITTAIQ